MISYANLIKLNIPFVPSSGRPSIDAIIDALNVDTPSKSFIDRYPVPHSQADKRRWIQAALTVRATGELPKALVDGMDQILQAELAQKLITDAVDLPRIDAAYSISGKVSIWNGNIATLKIDAITNAANAQMLGCFQPFHACIDNVIQSAAGPQLRDDCHQIMTNQGRDETTGTAKITRAYNLPSDFVLHTVGPIVSNHRPTQAQADHLASCYSSCLTLAAEVGVRSVAFCGISTGVFGYPAEEAAGVALRAVVDWMSKNQKAIDHIVFNTYGETATAIYRTATENWI